MQKADQLTLRDHFAGLAMQAMLSNSMIDTKEADIARLAYKQADAMLTARGEVVADDKDTAASDEWVSVLDRMPDESGWYEVSVAKTEFCGGEGVVINDFWSADTGRWTLCGEVVSEIPCYVESVVTHWRPVVSAATPSDALKAQISDDERDELIAALKKAQKDV
jgi:hypothetical protein